MQLTACNVTSSLGDGENLLTKNNVSFTEKITNQRNLKEDLVLIPLQKPNNKMFGLIPFRLGIYNLTFNKKENKFRWWLKNKVGEVPVIYSENASLKTTESIRLFMFNNGFLDNKVSFKTIVKNRKVVTNYSVEPNSAYTINKLVIPSPDNTLQTHLNVGNKASLLKVGETFNINQLELERKRISDYLRNVGYYNFRKDYLVFELDTNQTDKTVQVVLKIKEPSPGKWHQKYTVKNIYIYTDFDPTFNESAKLDTVQFEDYFFISEEYKFKPKIIANAILIEKDKVFSLDAYQSTLKKLVNYGTFKFVDIQFKTDNNIDPYALNTYVYLTSSKKQTVSFDLEANHRFIGLTGTSAGVSYTNKNLSKSADLLEVKVSSGVEFNFANIKDSTARVLNNADVTVQTNYYLNRFLLPFPLKKLSKYNNVKTKFQIQYNYERRIQFYSLHSTSFNFGYEWNEAKNKKHIYNPISAVLFILPKDKITQDFRDRLDAIPSLKRSFEEQLIIGSNYTYFYNNKKSDGDNSYMFFQGKVSLAGNFIHGIIALTKQAKNNPTPYNIFNRSYSQFARFEGNIIHKLILGKHASVNTRLNAGIIVPYGNSTVAPYFQQFYVGGSNSIRAFRLRALGPGTYADTANLDNANFFFDQAGDIKLEGTAELRFDIYKWFKGAFFVDAGNVWLLRKDPDRQGGEISANNFFNAIAVGTGFGLRLDFDYFVIRTDFSLPLVDPRFDDDRKYPLNTFQLNFGKNSWFRQHSIFHLAIGYPF